MSELSIFEKSQEIRFETEIYANTCERVADVLDDINTTKANKSDVASAIQVVVDEMTQMEQEIYDYVDDEVGALETEVAKKMTKPAWEGYEQQYIVISSNTPNNLRPITIGAYRIPVWTGNTFYSSPFYMSVDQTKLGLNVASPTEALDVLGNVRANAFRFISTSGSITVPNTLYTNGVNVIYTGTDGVPKELAFKTDPVAVVYTANLDPPTLAQLPSTIKAGDFLARVTSAGEIQRSMFDGKQLTNWAVSVERYNQLTTAQREAVKIFNIYEQ